MTDEDQRTVLAKWLREKFGNATIIEKPSAARIAYTFSHGLGWRELRVVVEECPELFPLDSEAVVRLAQYLDELCNSPVRAGGGQ